jgi:hypothetical protein
MPLSIMFYVSECEGVLLQFLFSPIFIGVFLTTLVTLEGRPSQVIPKLQQVVLKAFIHMSFRTSALRGFFSIFFCFLTCLSFCRSGFLLFLQIGSCGYLYNFSTSDLSPSNFRSLLLILLLLCGMWFSPL